MTGSHRDHLIIINDQSALIYTIALLTKSPENLTESQITRKAGGINYSKISKIK